MQIRTRLIACLFTIAALAGCGLTSNQIAKTQSFGSATENIGKLGEKEFVNIRNGIIDMNKELIAIDHTKTADSLAFDRANRQTRCRQCGAERLW